MAEWLAPRDGVMNVWVAPVADPAQARPLTAEQQRPIRSTFWSPDSKTVLYINDKGGDENFLLYGVEVASGTLKNYTPFEKTRARIVKISSKVKDRILVGLNNRDPRWHDVHSLDLASGKLTLVLKNDGYGDFLADDDLVLRLAQKSGADGGTDYFRLTDGQAEAILSSAWASRTHRRPSRDTSRPTGGRCTGPIPGAATRQPSWRRTLDRQHDGGRRGRPRRHRIGAVPPANGRGSGLCGRVP